MIQWLLVGFGRAGRCHAAAIDRTADARLAGIVDSRGHADTPQGTPVFGSLREALEVCRPDGVIVATPHESHLQIATEAVEAGLAVLCEKPVGRSGREAALLRDRASVHRVPVGVVLNQRACVHPRWIKDSLAEGALSCRAVRIWGALARLDGWNADPGVSGGGVLRTVGIHYLDLLRWWFGEPRWLVGSLAGDPVDDVADLLIGFQGGIRASLTLSAVAKHSAGPVNILIEGDTARISLRGHEIAGCEGLAAPPAVEPDVSGLFYGPGHLAVVQAATASLASGEPFATPLDEVLPLLNLIDEVYARAAEAPVFLDSL